MNLNFKIIFCAHFHGKVENPPHYVGFTSPEPGRTSVTWNFFHVEVTFGADSYPPSYSVPVFGFPSPARLRSSPGGRRAPRPDRLLRQLSFLRSTSGVPFSAPLRPSVDWRRSAAGIQLPIKQLLLLLLLLGRLGSPGFRNARSSRRRQNLFYRFKVIRARSYPIY